MNTAICIIPNCGRRAPALEPFCSKHRDRPLRDRDGSGEAGQTAQQAGPEATARPEGIAR